MPPDEKAQLLGSIMDAFFDAEFCDPQEKAERERHYVQLLEKASALSGKSVGVIKEAILKERYPSYRTQRLKKELGSMPPNLRRQ